MVSHVNTNEILYVKRAFEDILPGMAVYPKPSREHLFDSIYRLQYLSPIAHAINSNPITQEIFESCHSSFLRTAQGIKDRDLVKVFSPYVPENLQTEISLLRSTAQKAEFIRSQILTPTFCESLREIRCVRKDLLSIPPEVFRLPHLIFLDCIGNQISMIPETIGNAQELQELHLSENPIQILPNSLWSLRHLDYLSLANMQLSGPLPSEISQLTQLYDLDVSCNHITALPESLSELEQLEYFDAGQNDISAISEDLEGYLRGLHRMDIANNLLSQEQADRLAIDYSDDEGEDVMME